LRIRRHGSNIENAMSDHHAHTSSGEKVLGITQDSALRPIGILMTVIGATWALFAGMALEAGSYGQPLAALALIGLGVLFAEAGKPAEQI
jgi:hypothetical protein